MTIAPKHWYSWDFDVTDGARHVAHLDVSAWREQGVLTIDGVTHRVYREGGGSGEFLLERDGIVLARAIKPSAFRSAFEVRHDGRTYELAKESVRHLAGRHLVEACRPGRLLMNSSCRRAQASICADARRLRTAKRRPSRR